MAEDDQSQEKSEDPTSRKLEKARDDGQVPRSKELTTTAVLLGASLSMLWFGEFFADKLSKIFHYNFILSREKIFDPSSMISSLVQSFYSALIGLIPLFTLLFIAAILGPIALGGWLMSAKSLQPKLSRMNPLEGVKRMFSVKSLVELIKAIAKVVLMAILSLIVLSLLYDDLVSLAFEDIEVAITHSSLVSVWVIVALSAATIFIAVVDVPFQLWDHTKKLKMSLQDIKDEMKDTDGKPEIKSKIRQLQQEIANRKMMAEVPHADVIITNPSHYAIALQYKPNEMKTPRVIARGVDHMALKIREIAGAHQIEIVESPRLARAIYYTTRLDDEIPSGLYLAVAKILAYVFQLRHFREGKCQRPAFPHSVPIPDDLHYQPRNQH